MSNQSDELVRGTTALPEPERPEDPTDKQRLRISVPYLETAVTMGEGAMEGQLYEDDHTKVLHFPGFGVTTQGDLHLETRGPRESSRVKLQSHGEISIHSNQSALNIGAKQGVAIGTDGPGSLVAKSGVMIAGGWLGLGTVETGLQDPERRHHPATPAWVEDFGTVTGTISKLFALLDHSVKLHDAIQDRRASANALTEVNESEHDKKKKQELKRARERLQKFSLLMTIIGSAYEVWKATGNEPTEELAALEQAMAGTTIIGQGGINLATPSATNITGLLGVSLFSPAEVGIDGREYLSLGSGRCISINAGRSIETIAGKRLIQVAEEVAVLGANQRLTLAAEDELLIKTPGHETYYFGGDMLQNFEGERSTQADCQHITGLDKTVVDGKSLLQLVSSAGSAFLTAQDGVAAVGGSVAAAVHCEDAWVWAEPGKISITVEADAAKSNMDPAEYFASEIASLENKWSTARENEDYEAVVELGKKIDELKSKRADAAADYASKVEGHSPNSDNGIEISSSDVVIAVGGDKLSVKKGKVEVLKSLKVT